MFFCLSHLQPQSACSQAPVQNTLLDVCTNCQPLLFLSTGPEDAVGSSWPIPPRCLVLSTPIQCTPTPGLAPGERPPAPNNTLRAQQPEEKGAAGVSIPPSALWETDNWI